MALESGTYINSLNASNPASTDGLGQADDHLRLIKSTIKATFPNITGAVTLSHTDLNSIPSDLTDLGISDGTSGQFLTTDGSGNFSFASVTQGSSGIALTDLSVGAENAASGNGAISYDNSTGVFKYTPPTASGLGALTAHPSISAATTSTNSGSTFIQSIGVDGNGHVTSISTDTVSLPSTNGVVGTYIWGRPKNNTVYSAGDTDTNLFQVQSGGSYWSNSNNTFYEPTHTGTSVGGTWRAMTSTNTNSVGLWIRIS